MGSKELFHGTTMWRINPLFDYDEDLIGVRFLNTPELSAILTDDPSYAERCAKLAAEYDEIACNRRQRSVILRFVIPEDELVAEGPIGNSMGPPGYSTIHSVDPQTLRNTYFSALRIPREEAIRDVAAGRIIFYRVPHEYFTYQDPVDYRKPFVKR